jgi:hypothetical protein
MDLVRSKTCHDFQTCACGNVSVDGGSYYVRRCVRDGDDSYIDLVTLYRDAHVRSESSKDTNRRVREYSQWAIDEYKKGRTVHDIAVELEFYDQVVKNILKRNGVKIRPNSSYEYPKGEKNKQFGDGTRHLKGYLEIKLPWHYLAKSTGYVPYHRLVYSLFHGPLTDSMIVHHKNGDKTDNRPENLEAYENNGVHRKSHSKKQKRDKFGKFN